MNGSDITPWRSLNRVKQSALADMVGVSEGFRNAWPQTSDLIGAETRRHLINEAAYYCDDSDYLREAADGELLMVSCVSRRILSLGDTPEDDSRLRWHAVKCAATSWGSGCSAG